MNGWTEKKDVAVKRTVKSPARLKGDREDRKHSYENAISALSNK